MTMTREEQIFDIAAQYAINETDGQNGGKAASKRGLLLSAFRDGAHWADSHSNWISVENGLPKENEEVLAYNSLFNKKYLCVYHNGKFEDYLGELGKGAVSHWMPIVPPRKED